MMLLLLLTGGAIVNVAVAWGFAACASEPPTLFSSWYDIAGNWPADAPTSWPKDGYATTAQVIGLRETWVTSPDAPTMDHDPDISFEGALWCSGWPCLTMAWDSIDSKNMEYGGVIAWHRGLSLTWIIYDDTGRAGLWKDWRRLPIRPIWPGFAINTVFYAAVLWLLYAAPFALWGLRRRRRIKRGLCVKCAYPVGDSAVCTECGTTHAAKPAAKARTA